MNWSSDSGRGYTFDLRLAHHHLTQLDRTPICLKEQSIYIRYKKLKVFVKFFDDKGNKMIVL